MKDRLETYWAARMEGLSRQPGRWPAVSRLTVAVVVLVVAAAVCPGVMVGGEMAHVGGPGTDRERLLALKGAELHEFTRDSTTGAWRDRAIAAFHELMKEGCAFSGPVVTDEGEVFVVRSDYRSQRIDLYLWEPDSQMRHIGSGVVPAAGGGSRLTSGVGFEKLFLLAVPIAEGYAGWAITRPRADGTLSFGRFTDPLAASISAADVAAYSADGKLLVGASHGRMIAISRKTGDERRIDVPASFFSSIWVSNDGALVAWVGQRMPTADALQANDSRDQGPDEGFPEIDAVGLISLASGAGKIWHAGDVRGLQPRRGFRDQLGEKAQVSNTGRVLYFEWNGSLLRLDTESEALEELLACDDFVVVPDRFPEVVGRSGDRQGEEDRE